MNPVEAYQARKAEKKAAKEAAKRAEVEAKTRRPAQIEKDLDATSKEIGKWHHQMKCCEATIGGLTDKFHNYILELSESKKVYPDEFKAIAPGISAEGGPDVSL